MITRVVNIDTEEHAKEFDALVAKLGYVKSVGNPGISPEGMATGASGPLTDEEWERYFADHPNKGKGKTGTELINTY